MTEQLIAPRQRARRAGDSWLMLLGGALFLYATAGKSFAYLGLPPLFVGEIVVLAGLVVLIRTGALLAALASFPSLILAFLICLVGLRTLTFIGEYGFDALRDSVIVTYGVIALIVIAVLLEDPHRLTRMVSGYQRFVVIGISIMLILAVAAIAYKSVMPYFPREGVPLLQFRAGDFGVHVSGAAVFMLLGFRRARPLSLSIVCLAAVLAGSQNRGAMLAIAAPLALAAVVSGRWRALAGPAIGGAILLAAAYAIDVSVPDPGDRARDVGVRQLLENAVSVVGPSPIELDGTKQWRLDWWSTIVDYTFFGEYFWSGRGFGMSLAEADGFVVGDDPAAPPLRSPHSAHMTMLARAGVPGLALWSAMLLAWGAMLVASYSRARLRGEAGWALLFLFVGCYALAILISASVDVALEGPILGFWFWTLFGFGIGASMIHRVSAPRVSEP